MKKKSIFFFVTLFSISSFGRTLKFSLNLERDGLVEHAEKTKAERNLNFIVKENTITGKVTGELGESLFGASIKIKGTNKVESTDVDGSFSIAAKEGDVLIVSYVGYSTKEVTVGNQKQLNINLKSAQNDLSDVVVIGYQKVHKKNVNAAVSTISSKDLQDIPVISVSSLIASLATGIQTPTQTGAPGGRGALVIRGNTNLSTTGYSSPLYVIDGVQTTIEDVAGYETSNTDFLASLNPNDIEKIDFLKDASAAAIYGSRGANGVIIITTKKGGSLDKPEFTFSLSTGISPIPNLTAINVGSAERRAKMALLQRWWKSDDLKTSYVPMVLSDSLNPAFNNKVDYQGIFYRTGISNKYNLGMKGGNEASNYRLSLGYDNVQGVIRNSGFKRYTFMGNINSRVGQNFENQLRVNLVQTENQTGQGNPEGGRFQFNNTLPSDPSDLNSSLFYISDDKIKSLHGELSEKLNTDEVIQVTLSDLMKYDFSSAFSVNAQLNYVYSSQKKNYYEPSTVREEADGFASYALYNRKNLSSDLYINYFKKFSNHTISAVVGQKTDYNKYENMSVYAQGPGVDAIKVINNRYSDDQISGRTGIESNALLSYFGRLGYRYKDRYMIDVAFSRDGSSRFGENSRYANFSSVAVGWVFSDEPFIKNLGSNILTYGKLRASYGVNGREISENFMRYGSYQLGYGGTLWANQMSVSTYGGTTGVVTDYNTIGNSNLSWVNAKQWNIGFDMDLFHNRINITFDAYNKKTENLLFETIFPAYSGFNQGKSNIAGVINYGWESLVKFQIFSIENPWKLEVSVGGSQNKNYVNKLPNGNKDYYGKDPNTGRDYGCVIGLPFNLPVQFKNEYILDNLSQLPVNPFTGQMLHGSSSWGTIAPGTPIWKDYNGDYLLDDTSDYKLDTSFKPTPDFTGLFNLNLRYKGWYLQAYSQFSFGSDIIDTSSQRYLDNYDRGGENWAVKGLIDLSEMSFWKNPGDGEAGAHYPALYPARPNTTPYYRFRQGQSMWKESGDYWKITNASIGYTIDKSPILDQMHISRVRIYGSIINPYQWQRSKVVRDASQVDEMGYTLGNGYPQSKTISLGLDVKF